MDFLGAFYMSRRSGLGGYRLFSFRFDKYLSLVLFLNGKKYIFLAAFPDIGKTLSLFLQ